MGKRVRAGIAAVGLLAGCNSIPPLENPTLVRPGDCAQCENPVVVEPGVPTPDGYRDVYERVLNALDDYFDVKPSSRYGGKIETLPRIAPGYEQPWKPGSPDSHERWHATFQTIRHYAIVDIQAGERGGYKVYVEVYKELEDLSQPTGARGTGAIFQEATTVDRRTEVLAVQSSDRSWIPLGREPALEQAILRKIQRSGCK